MPVTAKFTPSFVPAHGCALCSPLERHDAPAMPLDTPSSTSSANSSRSRSCSGALSEREFLMLWPKLWHNSVVVPSPRARARARRAALLSDKTMPAPRRDCAVLAARPEAFHNGVAAPSKEEAHRARRAALCSVNTVRGTRAGAGVVLADGGQGTSSRRLRVAV